MDWEEEEEEEEEVELEVGGRSKLKRKRKRKERSAAGFAGGACLFLVVLFYFCIISSAQVTLAAGHEGALSLLMIIVLFLEFVFAMSKTVGVVLEGGATNEAQRVDERRSCQHFM